MTTSPLDEAEHVLLLRQARETLRITGLVKMEACEMQGQVYYFGPKPLISIF